MLGGRSSEEDKRTLREGTRGWLNSNPLQNPLSRLRTKLAFENATERKGRPRYGRHGMARRSKPTQGHARQGKHGKARRGAGGNTCQQSGAKQQKERSAMNAKYREGEHTRNLKENNNSAVRRHVSRTNGENTAAVGMHGWDAIGHVRIP